MIFLSRLLAHLTREPGAVEQAEECAPPPAPLTIVDIECALDDLRLLGITTANTGVADLRRHIAQQLGRTEREVYEVLVGRALEHELSRTTAYKLATARRVGAHGVRPQGGR